MRQFIIPLLLGLALVAPVRIGVAQTPARDDAKATPNPQMALWLDLKRELQGPNGKQYFETFLRNAMVPGKNDNVLALRGTLVATNPPKKPFDLILALSDHHTPEVTLNLRDSRESQVSLPKAPALGVEMEFWGIPVAFSQNPFMLTFEVKPENGPAGANPRMFIPRKPK